MARARARPRRWRLAPGPGFQLTNTHGWTSTVTDAGSVQDVNVTLGDDADGDVVSGINVDVTSAATGDADNLYGLNISGTTKEATGGGTAIGVGGGLGEAV